MQIVAISRGNKYSPNHVGNDAAILQAACQELELAGYLVTLYTEEAFVAQQPVAKYILSMARDEKTIACLTEYEHQGSIIFNSPKGIRNCIRKPMTEKLLEYKIPHPKSTILPTANFSTDSLTTLHYPCWIKRGDSHAMVKEDVCYATSVSEAALILTDFCERDIPVAVVNQHLSGDLVKFYGVLGTDFFYTFYPSPATHSKFGLELINGIAKGYDYDVSDLQQIANRAAQILSVPIYGGDAIVSSDGTIQLIDFNDWPSFSPCREEAAASISQAVTAQIEKKHRRLRVAL
ncbi:MAG: hypothetical protein ACRC3Z_06805 [Phocaeicola sp.]